MTHLTPGPLFTAELHHHILVPDFQPGDFVDLVRVRLQDGVKPRLRASSAPYFAILPQETLLGGATRHTTGNSEVFVKIGVAMITDNLDPTAEGQPRYRVRLSN